MAWTQADISALKAAIASGVKQVHYSGPPARTVTYHDLREMRDLLAEMERSVSSAPKNYVLIQTRKGT